MKKALAFILALCLCVGLCACGGTVGSDNQPTGDLTSDTESTANNQTVAPEKESVGINTEVYTNIKNYILNNGQSKEGQSNYSYRHPTNKYITPLTFTYLEEDDKISVQTIHYETMTIVYQVILFISAKDNAITFETQHVTADDSHESGIRIIKGTGKLDIQGVTSLTQVPFDVITDNTGRDVPFGYESAFSNRIHGVLSATEEFLALNSLGSLTLLGFKNYTPPEQLGELSFILPKDETPVNKIEIEIGQEVSSPDQYVFTVKSAEFTTKFSETYGDWVYSLEIKDKEKIYLAIKIDIMNLTTESISSFALNTSREPNNGLGVDVEMVYNDKYNYDGSYRILNDKDISPLTSGIVYAYFEVPAMIATDKGSVVVTLDIMGTLYTLNIR